MNKGVESLDRQSGLVFDKRQTNIAKGVALLLLLWHHLFYNSPQKYEMFTSVFLLRGVPIECQIARFCKVCVSVFLLLSGYGLTKSFSKYYKQNSVDGKLPLKKNCRYVVNHLVGLLSDYWMIFIIFVPMGLLFGKNFFSYYGTNPIYYLADFFGVSYLFFQYSYTMNVTWWFMSIIIVYYLIFPLLHKLLRYSPELLMLIAVFILFCPFIPDFRQLKLWICPFVFGMYISNYNSFDVLGRRVNTNFKAVYFSALAVVITAYLRFALYGDQVTIDFLFAFSIIASSFLILSKIPVLNTVLEHLGKHSGMIFMFHTFIFSLYFEEFIYWFKYSPVIFIVMVVVGLEWLKKITRYNKLFLKL